MGRNVPITARRPRATAHGGFTLIELAIATSILLIGLVSAIQATSQMHALRLSNRERVLAQNALRSQAERMHARAHALAIDPGTWARGVLDAFGPGGTPGNTFPVEGLTSLDGSGVVGTIQVLTSETLTDVGLRAELGLPRDLNGDGDSADADVSDDARLLPVLLTIRWRGEGGERVVRHALYLPGY